uniref:Tyrosine-protein kinase receptor n=1 Tax=Parascaris univalens TaxID=6257 RepID=A0A915CCA5_PARUN
MKKVHVIFTVQWCEFHRESYPFISEDRMTITYYEKGKVCIK